MHYANTTGTVLSLLLATTAGAQIQAALETGTPLGVYAIGNGIGGTLIDFRSTARGLAIQKWVGLSVRAITGNSQWSTMVSFQHWPGDVITIGFNGQGGFMVSSGSGPGYAGTSPSPPGPSFVPGPHSVLLTLRGSAGSRGLIETWTTGGLSNAGTIAGGHGMDIGDDNQFEFQGPVIGHARGSFAVQFPANGILLIRLQTRVEGSQTSLGGFTCKTGISLQFTPAPLCVGKPYGSTCGPEITGQSTPAGGDYLFDIGVTKSMANAPGLMVIGMDPVEIPVPGIQCPVLTSPLVALRFVTDALGQHALRFRLPQSTILDLRVQVADLGGGTAKASNGLHIACLR